MRNLRRIRRLTFLALLVPIGLGVFTVLRQWYPQDRGEIDETADQTSRGIASDAAEGIFGGDHGSEEIVYSGKDKSADEMPHEEILECLGVDRGSLRELRNTHDSRRKTKSGRAFTFGQRGFIEFTPKMTRVITFFGNDYLEGNIAEGQAKDLVLEVLEKCGLNSNLDGLELKVSSAASVRKTVLGQWDFLAPWRYKDIETQCGVQITLNGDGTVFGIKATPFVPPASINPRLSAQDGLALGKEVLKKALGVEEDVESTVTLMIVHGNNAFLPSTKEMTVFSEETYLVWEIDFSCGYAGSTIIYIDAIDGTVVGGIM